MNLLARIKGWFGGAEGSYRGPVTGYSQWGNPYPISFGDGFQEGLSIGRTGAQHVPAAYACVMAVARAVSMCYAQHMTIKNNKTVKSTTSPASRVLRKPNSYQTWPQFILNAISRMLFVGEAFVQLVRDDRGAITAMHLLPPGSCTPYVAIDGSIFYSVGQNPMNPTETSYMAPAREIMHLRQHTPRHPLIGETALTSAALALGTNVALSGNQAAFYANMNRPSGILSTDEKLTRDQMMQLRAAFDEQAKGMNAGKIPVLSSGLKWQAIGITSQDSQLIQAQRMSIEDIARVFGVPLPVIGDLSNATMNNTESMINFWLATGLGSTLELIERSLDDAFGLTGEDYIELDTKALLRMDFKSRMESLAKGVQGGVITVNEAREFDGQGPVADGDTILVQQQMVSLEYAVSQKAPDPNAATPAAPAAPAAPAEGDPADSADSEADPVVSRALVVDIFARKRA